GDKPELPDSLKKAGVTAQILGPPKDEKMLAVMDNKQHQYLSADAGGGATPVRLSDAFKGKVADYPKSAWDIFSVKEIQDQITGSQPSLAAAMAAKVDNAVNNQSLVVLFTINGKTLLFPGDAQWGNWDNWLFGTLKVEDTTPLTATAKNILGNLDFYKVGHHGSTNANPINAVEALRQGCVAMVSTACTAYGEPSKKSEVPRIRLLEELTKRTNNQLARSDQVALTAAQTNGKAVPAPYPGGKDAKGEKWPAAPPLPNVFKTGPEGTFYIDYEM
ncbi:MAG TPA: hypothetical protein VE826_15170, partial [Dongiaceae bacterium]|nr:hypothetical protein [Dongiaceae bacterium]